MSGINYNIGLNTSLWNKGLRGAGRGITRLGGLLTSNVAQWTAAFTGVGSAIVGIQKAIDLGAVARQYRLTGGAVEGLAKAFAAAGIEQGAMIDALNRLGLRDSSDIIKDLREQIEGAASATSGWGDASIFLEKSWRKLKSGAMSFGGGLFEGLLQGRDLLSGGISGMNAGIASRLSRRNSEANELDSLLRRVERQFAQSARMRDLQASGGNFMTGLTGNQRMGAFSRRPSNLLLTVQQQQLQELKKISAAVGAGGGGSTATSSGQQTAQRFFFNSGFFAR